MQKLMVNIPKSKFLKIETPPRFFLTTKTQILRNVDLGFGLVATGPTGATFDAEASLLPEPGFKP